MNEVTGAGGIFGMTCNVKSSLFSLESACPARINSPIGVSSLLRKITLNSAKKIVSGVRASKAMSYIEF